MIPAYLGVVAVTGTVPMPTHLTIPNWEGMVQNENVDRQTMVSSNDGAAAIGAFGSVVSAGSATVSWSSKLVQK